MNLEARLQELVTLNAIGEVLNREGEFERALPLALEKLVSLLTLQTGWVFLTTVEAGNSHEGSFRLSAFTGLPSALAANGQEALCNDRCECQNLLKRGKLDRGVNMVTCSRLADAEGDTSGLSIHASIPLLAQEGPIGIMNVAAPGDKRFEQGTLQFLTAVGRQLGAAFERSRLQAERTREARYSATLEERQRLAQDMHDSVSQLLFAADLSLQIARGNAEQQGRALERASELVQEALSELRALTEAMRTADLSAGLVPALARLAKRTSGLPAMQLEAEPIEVSGPTAETLYRVAQEAVHNALRHAGAERVILRLRRVPGGVGLVVEDDGKGFDPARAPQGLGLSGLASRSRALGGRFTLESRIGAGTRIEVVVPWPASS